MFGECHPDGDACRGASYSVCKERCPLKHGDSFGSGKNKGSCFWKYCWNDGTACGTVWDRCGKYKRGGYHKVAANKFVDQYCEKKTRMDIWMDKRTKMDWYKIWEM